MRRPTTPRPLLAPLAAAAFAALIAGCAAGGRAPAAEGGPRVPLVRDPAAPPWTITEPGRRRGQRVRILAELVSRTDSVARRDSLESVLDVAWGDVPEASPARLAGMVTAFAIRVPPDRAEQTPSGVRPPFSFVAEQVPGAMPRLTTPDGASCTDLHAMAVQGWREAWLPLPGRLEPGQQWQDSSRYVMCRDGIPLTVETVRRFVVDSAVERGGELLLMVRRRTTTTLSGDGFQFGEPVRLRGEGAGEMLMALSPSGGVIVSGEGRSVLQVHLEGRRRRQELLQTSRILISEPD